jgi:hypothetical protein
MTDGASDDGRDGGREPPDERSHAPNRNDGDDLPADAADGDLPRFRSGPGLGSRVRDAVAGMRLSAAVSGVVTLVVALSLGSQLFGVRLATLSVLAGTLLALGLYALASDRSRVLLAGGLLVAPAAVLVAVSLAIGFAFGLRTGSLGNLAGVSVLLLVAGSFAAVLTVAPSGERDILGGAFMRFIGMLIPLTVVQVLVVTAAAWEAVVVALADLVVDSPEPLLALGRALLAPRGTLALLTFLLYIALAVVLMRLVVTSLPIIKLFPPRRRPTVAGRVRSTERLLRRVSLVVGAGAVAVYVVATVAGVASLSAIARVLDPPLAGFAVALLSSTWLRVVLVIVNGAMLAILVAERLRRRARRLSEADLLRQSMPPLGAAIVAFAAGVALDLVTTRAQLLAQVPPGVRDTAGTLLESGLLPAAVLVTFGSLIVVGALLIVLTILGGTSLLPSRAMGPAMAAAAVFALALVVLLFGGSPLVAFLGAAAALFGWDAGELATGLREELGVDAITVRGELVHVGGSLAVGLGAVVFAFVLELLVVSEAIVPRVPDLALAGGALTLVFLTVIVLLSSLRD